MKLRVSIALFACLALAAPVAHAQMSEGERKAAARAAYTEGVALQDKGSPAEALARFEAAQKLFDAPTHLLHIAECQALTGKLVEASETYETLIHKQLAKDAPDAFVQAQEQGRAELAQLHPRIPTMRVTVKPDAATLQNLQITVNDRQMPAELVGIARPVNPGAYKLNATATGYATAAPVEVEVKEREPKSVDLVLQKGNGAVVVLPPPVTTTPPPPNGAPAPYEQPKPKPESGPSANGLLFGVRPAFFVPTGDVAKDVSFDTKASAGPGFGVDLIGRVAKLILVGGTIEYASLGAPDSSKVPAGTTASYTTNMIYAGVLVGILPNVDRVSFIADVDAGLRFLNQSVSATALGKTVDSDDKVNGLDLGLNAGVSIPAGPIRIVPKAGLSLGQFSNQSCSITGLNVAPSGCTSGAISDTGVHTILTVGLGIYYHLDLAKKSASASRSPAGNAVAAN